MNKETQVAKTDPKEFGLEEKSVKDIELAFAPKIAERDGYVEIYNGLLTKEITPSLAVECGDLRKKLVKVRTGIAAVHKTQKAYFLAAGKYVDAWKKRETTPVLQMEEKLAEVEKFQEIQAKKERDELQAKRVLELTPYVEDAAERLLYGMADDVWSAYLTAKKTEHTDKLAAEQKIEDERLAKLAVMNLRATRDLALRPYFTFIPTNHPDLGTLSDDEWDDFFDEMKSAKSIDDEKKAEIEKENLRLKKEKEDNKKAEKTKKDQAIKDQNAKIESRRMATIKFLLANGFENAHGGMTNKSTDYFIEAINYSKLETNAEFDSFCLGVTKSIEAAKDKKEAKAALSKLKAKEDAEKLAEEQKAALLQSELNKGDAAKVKDLLSDLEGLKTKYSFKSAKNKVMYKRVVELLDKVKEDINKH